MSRDAGSQQPDRGRWRWRPAPWAVVLGVAGTGLTAAAELMGGEITWLRAVLWTAAAAAVSAGALLEAGRRRAPTPEQEVPAPSDTAPSRASDHMPRVQQGPMVHYGSGDQYQAAGDQYFQTTPDPDGTNQARE
jgi:hypothetical protein